MHRRLTTVCLLLALALVTGCSGDDDDTAGIVLRTAVSTLGDVATGCDPMMPGGQPLPGPGTPGLYVDRTVSLDETIAFPVQWEQATTSGSMVRKASPVAAMRSSEARIRWVPPTMARTLSRPVTSNSRWIVFTAP